MGVEPTTQPVYPVQTAPPPYSATVGAPAATVAVEMQPVILQPAYANQAYLGQQPTTVVIQQQPAPVAAPAAATTVIVASVATVKRVEQEQPYLEYCPRCQTSVTTRTMHSAGACWWIICFIGCFLVCWPILFFLSCNSSKDVKHFCPNCGTMLAFKKRGC